jgi:hypothetical protein
MARQCGRPVFDGCRRGFFVFLSPSQADELSSCSGGAVAPNTTSLPGFYIRWERFSLEGQPIFTARLPLLHIRRDPEAGIPERRGRPKGNEEIVGNCPHLSDKKTKPGKCPEWSGQETRDVTAKQ